MNRYPAPQHGPRLGSLEWLADMGGVLGVSVLLGVVIFALLWLLVLPARRARGLGSGTASDPTRPVVQCRWKRAGRRQRFSMVTRWVCKECGAEGITTDGEPPVTCKRHLQEEHP